MAEVNTGIINGVSERVLHLLLAVFSERKIDGLVATGIAIAWLKRAEPVTVPIQVRELDRCFLKAKGPHVSGNLIPSQLVGQRVRGLVVADDDHQRE